MVHSARRIGTAAATVGTATLAMIAAHCGGHQLAAWLRLAPAVESGVAAATRSAEHAHHLAHVSGFAPTAPSLAHDHGHVLPMASGAFLLAILGALGVLLALRRRRTPRAPRVAVLLAIQLVAFAVLELTERVPGGP